jgi:magnesium transporter
MFSGAIQKIVALAALMPIVASMGGNAGTQTLTVVIRALATKEISAANAVRVVLKECIVGILNGAFFALLMTAIVFYFYQDVKLALVMAAALIFNLFAAGLTGALIPLGIAKLGLDPAPSSAIFLTTVTDVVGFMAFLGLASWFLM